MSGAGTRLRRWSAAYGRARGTITVFVLLLFVGAALADLSIGQLASQSLQRIGMNLVLVLALMPMIRVGAGPNFGLSLGIVAGLLGTVVVMNADLAGWPGFLLAIAIGAGVAIPIGVVYGLVLNAVRGNEMIVGMFLGWCFVSLFGVFWLEAPFHHPELVWAIGGKGLRQTLTMRESFGDILDGALAGPESWLPGGLRLRLGLFLAAGVLFVLVWLFFRTRAGLAVRAAGENPRFARASGVRVGRTRVVAITLSTVLGAVGIVIYSQSYGFAQLYYAPFWMPFPAVAAILIGGASIRKATLFHVFAGTVLFQTILTVAPPVIGAGVPGVDISESLRITVQNGVILYALARAAR